MKQDHTFIVGDVHGCFDELMLLLQKAQYHPEKHRLIFVGDVVNKGKKSLEVLQWMRERDLESVLGNHEAKFIHSVENNLPLEQPLLKLKEDMGSQLQNWIDFIKSWPLYIEEEDFLLVHAGLVPGEHPSKSEVGNLINVRHWDDEKRSLCSGSKGRPWHDYYTDKKLVIYGHWAKQGVLKRNNSIGLDSGCVYGRQLTGVFLPSRTLISVNSLL